jgi:hypothetical protein
MQQLTIEIVPHPRSRGDWLLKPSRGAPLGLWFRDRQFAINDAEWVAKETDRAQILVYGADGVVGERRDPGKGTVPKSTPRVRAPLLDTVNML